MKAKLLALSALGTSALGNVYAAVPTEVTTAITDMKADAVTVATGFLVAAIVVTAFLFMRRGAK
jgi:hypothetical protein